MSHLDKPAHFISSVLSLQYIQTENALKISKGICLITVVFFSYMLIIFFCFITCCP